MSQSFSAEFEENVVTKDVLVVEDYSNTKHDIDESTKIVVVENDFIDLSNDDYGANLEAMWKTESMSPAFMLLAPPSQSCSDVNLVTRACT